MKGWMQSFIDEHLQYPEMVVLVSTSSLNPENSYYYQFTHGDSYKSVKKRQMFDDFDKREQVSICPSRSKEEVEEIIANFTP
mmetsp:Transcript_23024/g.35608  ORF Transcript_23024/g.35608 Transcript_23024/m.35608 type:complete len:82 (+) Transcript_23024:1993-2238(+)